MNHSAVAHAVISLQLLAGSASLARAQELSPPEPPQAQPEPALTPESPTVERPVTPPAVIETNVDLAAKGKIEVAVEALKKAKSMSFTAKFYMEGDGASMMGTSEAKVIALREGNAWSHRMTGKGKRTSKSTESRFDIASMGAISEWLDHDAKKLHVRSSRPSGKAVEAAGNLRDVSTLLGPAPFTKELASKTIESRSDETIDGIECETVFASAGPGGMDFLISLGKQDHLPRRLLRERTSTRGESKMIVDLSGLVLNDPVKLEDIHIALPEGFTKEDVSSPAMPSPASPPKPASSAAVPVNPDGTLPAPGTPPGDTETVITPSPDGSPAIIAPPSRGESGDDAAHPVTLPGNDAPMVQAPALEAPTQIPTAAEVNVLPEFDLTTTNEEHVTNVTIRGKYAVLMFWGSWSLTSKKALPEFQSLAQDYKDNLNFYAIATRQKTRTAPADAAKDAEFVLPVILQGDRLADALHVSTFPAFYVISPEGDILYRSSAYKGVETLTRVRETLDKSLGLPPSPSPARPETSPVTPDQAGEDQGPPPAP
jgi:thiol-disulfide isomerase/thioredoxin